MFCSKWTSHPISHLRLGILRDRETHYHKIDDSIYLSSKKHDTNILSLIYNVMLFWHTWPHPACLTSPWHTWPHPDRPDLTLTDLTSPWHTWPHPDIPDLTLTYLTSPWHTWPHPDIPDLILTYLTSPWQIVDNHTIVYMFCLNINGLLLLITWDDMRVRGYGV